MDSVRTELCALRRVLNQGMRPRGARYRQLPTGPIRSEFIVLDLVYAIGVIALFALIGLLAKAVEKL